MKTLITAYLILFTFFSPLCQEVARYFVVDKDSDFNYELRSISPDNLSAILYNRENKKEYTVKKGDRIPGFNLNEKEIEYLNSLVLDREKEKFETDLQKELDEFFKKNNLKKSPFEHLQLESALDNFTPNEEKFKKMLNFIVVKKIDEDVIELEDTLRGTVWKIVREELQQMVFDLKLTPKNLNVKRTGGFIVMDGKKEADYKDSVTVGNYVISACHNDKDIFFYVEYYIDEPALKNDDVFVIKFNEKDRKNFYEHIHSDDYLELAFMFFDEKEINDFSKGTSKSVLFDLWSWEYSLRNNKYLYDMNGLFSATRKRVDPESDFEEIDVKIGSDQMYLYINPDEGNMISDDFVFSPDRYMGDVYVPGSPNLEANGSQTDVICTSYFQDNTSSPYLTGKIAIEFKRPFNTNNSDDILLNKANNYILKPVDYRSILKPDFSKSVKLIFQN